MELAEHITSAAVCTKQAFTHIDGIITWVKLFLAVTIPLIAGIGVATAILQLLVKPLLVSILVTPNLGFTEDGIAHMLQYAAVIIGFSFVFIFPYYQGYLSRCMKVCGIPAIGNSHELFTSGWKINALILYYAIPLVVIFLLYAILFTFVNGALNLVLTGDLAALTALLDYMSLIVYLILEFATAIFLSIFACIGLVHLARTGSLRASVNMGKIADLIKKIGWYNYILSIVIVAILFLTIIVLFLGLASIFGYATLSNILLSGLMIFIIIPFGVFVAHFMSNVYDTAFLEPEEDIEDFDDF